MKRIRLLPAVAFAILPTLLSVSPVAPQDAADNTSGEIESLVAFARLYGHVRYFHPSDEAAAIDWDAFAIHGVEQAQRARGPVELQRTLEKLYLPIAPSLRLYRASEPSPSTIRLIPPDTTGLEVVAWQHLGAGLGQVSQTYRSVRTNREWPESSGGFGPVVQSMEATPYRGRRIRLRGAVRAEVEGIGNQGALWLRVDLPDQELGFFDNMEDRPITSSAWSTYEIEGAVAEDAVRIAFGAFLVGQGQLWVDGLELMVESTDGEWSPIQIENPGFEVGSRSPAGWRAATAGYSFVLDEVEPNEGQRSLRIASEAIEVPPPLPGITVEKPLGAGLAAQVPLALYGDASGTWPRDPSFPMDSLQAALGAIDPTEMTPDDSRVRLADVVIAWNIFQHFYPYFDVVEVDWEAELRGALNRALTDSGAVEFQRTLQMLLAAAQDGHADIRDPRLPRAHVPPFRVDWVEDQVVVVATADSTWFWPGDVVVSVDRTDAAEVLREAERYLSGSPQWRRWRALSSFAAGDSGTTIDMTLERDGRRFEIMAARTHSGSVPLPEHEHVERLGSGIWYVNLDTAPPEVIQSHLDSLAAAQGVIFDMRGYPDTNLSDVIRHLLTVADTTRWMFVPHILYPDQERVDEYDERGWNLEPADPRIEGRVAFLTSAEAISQSESIMGYVEGYGLGEIVGSATAGTNGNVQFFNLPGGFQGRFTGMRVLKHDGSQHHLIGVLPTVPVEPTIEGIREGRDEVLERAIEIVTSP
jgi:hypothetical protein